MEQSLVRLLTRDGKQPLGVGFLVSPQHIMTCAHVVTAVLGLPIETLSAPSQPVLLDFPLLDVYQRKQQATAKVIAWRAYRANLASIGDIACLQLDAAAPIGTHPVQIRVKASLWKQPFRAFGVPTGLSQGVWAEGEILGRQSNGYFQVETTRATGYVIQPGFSGGPVWSEQMQAVVAMLTLAEKTPNVHAAFAIPARLILEVLNEVKPEMQHGTHAITLLSEVMGLDVALLPQLTNQHYSAAQHPNADTDDLLSAGLLKLWMGRYDLARNILERLVQREPTHGYGHYALALSHFEGRPAGQLQNFNKARQLSDLLENAIGGNAPAHIHLLSYYLRYAYFRRNGFTALMGDLQAYSDIIRKSLVQSPEIQALAHVLPDITTLPLWQELGQGG